MRDELVAFTGNDWKQEDDVTMVVLYQTPDLSTKGINPQCTLCLLSEWIIASSPGNERQVSEQVASIIQPLSLQTTEVENLKTAVAETVMNAVEHGSQYQLDKPVTIQVLANERTLSVRVRDEGGERAIAEPEIPDIDAKLAGLQTSRGWGLFLIKHLVDDLRITNENHTHMVELIIYRNKNQVSNILHP